MRSWLLRVAAVALLLGLPPALQAESVLACSCLPPPPVWESVEGASVVFAGRVQSLDHWEGEDDHGVHVTFAVSRVWKGPVSSELVANTRSLGLGDCGYPFDLWEEYLVYAYGDALDIHLCSRTAPLSYAAEDLETLGEGHAPVAGATGEVEVVAPPQPPAVGTGAAAAQQEGGDLLWWLLATVAVGLAGAGLAAIRRRARQT